MSLRNILDEYIAFQEQVIIRRTQYDLKKAMERAHLLEGLLIAQDNIDEVISIIRSSYSNAKERLMERFSLDDVQAQAICDMRLISLQGLKQGQNFGLLLVVHQGQHDNREIGLHGGLGKKLIENHLG